MIYGQKILEFKNFNEEKIFPNLELLIEFSSAKFPLFIFFNQWESLFLLLLIEIIISFPHSNAETGYD